MENISLMWVVNPDKAHGKFVKFDIGVSPFPFEIDIKPHTGLNQNEFQAINKMSQENCN